MLTVASVREPLAHFSILVASHKRRRRPPLGVVLALLWLTALAPSCGSDECTARHKRCQANTVQTCEEDSSCEWSSCRLFWQDLSACDTSSTSGDASVCVAPSDGQAFCALSNTPDPNCADVFGYCSGATLTTCSNGFAVTREPCASPSVCSVLADKTPICALSASPDPRCTAGDGLRCDGATLLTCSRGYAVASETCPVVCVTAEGVDTGPEVMVVPAGTAPSGLPPEKTRRKVAVCALSAEPDARCGPDCFDGYCEADTHVSCCFGYALGRDVCPVGSTCTKLGCDLAF